MAEKEEAMEAGRGGGLTFEFVPEELWKSPELCLAAVRQYGRALEDVPAR
jgi:hypothetical protein